MQQRTVIGLVEEVTVFGPAGNARTSARIDTGAHSNSIDSGIVRKLGLDIPEQTTLVKSASGNTRRPVAQLDIEIAGKRLSGRFTIADRKHLKYHVLVGRDILKHGFLIDPQK